MTNTDYLYDASAAKNIFAHDYHVKKKSGFRIIERGTIIPYVPKVENGVRIWEFGGLVDSDGRFIKSSVGKFGENDIFTAPDNVKFVPATVIYLGMFYPVWGHLITEGLRYFWALNNSFFRTYLKNCSAVYIPAVAEYCIERHKNFSRLLEILNIDIDRLQPIYHPVQFENIVMPDESFFLKCNENERYFTDEYRQTVDRVRNFAMKNRTPSAKKIYYFYGKSQIGEERLAEFFRDRGYEIISPERLTLDEQLNILINAESFASTVGSCSHNSIFLRDNSELILIPRAAGRFTKYQPTIDQMHPLNISYVDSSLSIFETLNGPYCFIISEQLKKFFGENFDGYTDDDLKIFLQYIRYSMSKGLKLNENSLTYYATIHQQFIDALRRREDLLKAYGVNLS